MSPVPHAEPFPHRQVPASQRSPALQHELPHAGPAQLLLGAHVVPAVTALQRLLSHVAMIVSPGPGAPPSSAKSACWQPRGPQARHASYVASMLANIASLVAAMPTTTVPQQSAEWTSTQSLTDAHVRSSAA